MEETNLLVQWLIDHGFKVAAIAVGAWLAHRFVTSFLGKIVRQAIKPSHFKDKRDEKQREDTLISIIRGVLGVLIWLAAILIIISEFGIEIGPLLAGAGIAGVAVGFGAQYLIRDLISGLFIILENQYRVGDVVRLDDTSGRVEDISLRVTVLRDLDGNVHHVPNGSIDRATNLTKEESGINFEIGVAYSSDIDQVFEVIQQVCKQMLAEDKWKNKIKELPRILRVDDFADSAIMIKITGKTVPLQQWDAAGELRKRLKAAFDAAGIEIPFPQRVIHQAKG